MFGSSQKKFLPNGLSEANWHTLGYGNTVPESSRSVEWPEFTEKTVQCHHTPDPLDPFQKIQITPTDWSQVSIGLVPGL